MFIRDFLYTIKILMRAKVSIFWTLVFPILLATFMYMAFGNIYEQDEMFSNIKVAVVTEDESANGLNYMLDALSDGDDALLSVTRMSESDAEKLLADEEVEGIIYTDDVKLTVAESSVNASILETVLSEYKQYEHALKDIYKYGTEPKGDMSNLVEKLSEQRSYYTEKASTEGSQNVYNNYFYAIFAMSCLFASLSSIEMMSNLQANVSATGKRKNVSPQRKMTFVLAEFAALLLIHFVVEVISFIYMSCIGVDFGDRVWEILLTLFVGCFIGLAIGVIVGAISKLAEGTKIGIVIGISMVMSILSDLCINGIKYEIQQHVPIINKLNPAALISDSFYALNVYSDHQVFTENIVIMTIEAVVLIAVGILMVRRNRYASV
ncbi:ABC transporter permease [Coprococcus eutactus]|jgi:ABC-2 type transport system permease protein|uniref:ABC transporter permease n=1 Tax=Coprococcus eutactus TaxID=33043 RepID=UPI001C0374E5|nr:ABC transporter permease [Coprococcus eutactus]MBT9731202.1 ABC transporter permease [Coprococcus eutactus]MBT9755943.1 ABC transporter permease [Coprococcus eutactus]